MFLNSFAFERNGPLFFSIRSIFACFWFLWLICFRFFFSDLISLFCCFFFVLLFSIESFCALYRFQSVFQFQFWNPKNSDGMVLNSLAFEGNGPVFFRFDRFFCAWSVFRFSIRFFFPIWSPFFSGFFFVLRFSIGFLPPSRSQSIFQFWNPKNFDGMFLKSLSFELHLHSLLASYGATWDFVICWYVMHEYHLFFVLIRLASGFGLHIYLCLFSTVD